MMTSLFLDGDKIALAFVSARTKENKILSLLFSESSMGHPTVPSYLKTKEDKQKKGAEILKKLENLLACLPKDCILPVNEWLSKRHDEIEDVVRNLIKTSVFDYCEFILCLVRSSQWEKSINVKDGVHKRGGKSKTLDDINAIASDTVIVAAKYQSKGCSEKNNKSKMRNLQMASNDSCSPGQPLLPRLILSSLTFCSISPDGAMSAAFHITLPQEVALNNVRYIGSYEDWIIGARLSQSRRCADEDCFLLNLFSHAVIHLPSPCAFEFIRSSSGAVTNYTGKVSHLIRGLASSRWLRKAVLSCSPDSGYECIIAAISEGRTSPKLAICRPGMKSWNIWDGISTDNPSDIVFHHGKIYIIERNSAALFVFELGEHDYGTPVITSVKQVMINLLPQLMSDYSAKQIFKLVESKNKLLVFIRHIHSNLDIWGIDLMELDFSTSPHRCNQLKSLNGESLFISECCSKSFPAGQHGKLKDNYIYFLHKGLTKRPHGDMAAHALMYDMRDGTSGC